MKDYELGTFTALFLKRQGLDDFSLVFKPFKVRTKARRSKRENTLIKGEDPLRTPKLPGTRKVSDLIELFHKLSPKTREWTDGPRSYRLKLSDDQGKEVLLTEALSTTRQRPESRHQANITDVDKAIKDALDYADTLLNSKEISLLIREAMRTRYGK